MKQPLFESDYHQQKISRRNRRQHVFQIHPTFYNNHGVHSMKNVQRRTICTVSKRSGFFVAVIMLRYAALNQSTISALRLKSNLIHAKTAAKPCNFAIKLSRSKIM